MPDRETLTYHFEEDASPEHLKEKSERYFQEGWRKAGAWRQIEIRFPDGRSTVRYSQAFVRCQPRDGGEARLRRCLGHDDGGVDHVSWRDLKACEHWLQVYGEEEDLMESLVGFVRQGSQAGDALVLIATPEHRAALRTLLVADGIDVEAAAWDNRITMLDAEETLERFMVRGTPDPDRFNAVIGGLVQQVRRPGRGVRAFGEMVALLWERGEMSAMMKLEHLWHVLCQREDVGLFCAYPRCGFDPGSREQLRAICAAHTRVVG